eukprot:GHVU01127322.1.p3 GENE.GHVU01127322.1~~GHVU01127322.1.p3  ORF type:complete len:123 (-),score=4.07 GHVU01127322.1:601-969(-)
MGDNATAPLGWIPTSCPLRVPHGACRDLDPHVCVHAVTFSLPCSVSGAGKQEITCVGAANTRCADIPIQEDGVPSTLAGPDVSEEEPGREWESRLKTDYKKCASIALRGLPVHISSTTPIDL